jgi:hypothetical protein
MIMDIPGFTAEMSIRTEQQLLDSARGGVAVVNRSFNNSTLGVKVIPSRTQQCDDCLDICSGMSSTTGTINCIFKCHKLGFC